MALARLLVEVRELVRREGGRLPAVEREEQGGAGADICRDERAQASCIAARGMHEMARPT